MFPFAPLLDPLSFASPPSFIALILAFIITTILLPARVLGIFSLTISVFSPPLSWNSNFWGLFVLFRLSYLYLMRQRSSPSLMRGQSSSTFLHVPEVSRSPGYRLEVTCGSFVHLASSKVYPSLSPRESFSRGILLFLITRCLLGLLSNIQAWPSSTPWPNPLLGLRPGRGFF